jgi:Spy/CpxP family protein refolding chaperone
MEGFEMNAKGLMGTGVIAVMALFLFATAPVYAEGESYRPRQKWGSEKQEKYHRMIEKLGLSDDQVAQLKAHKQAKIESREKLYSELAKQKQALRDELEKPVSDDARIKQISDSMKQIQSKLVDERIKGILEIKAILTPEQYAEFKAKMGKYKEHKIQRVTGEEKEKPFTKHGRKKY